MEKINRSSLKASYLNHKLLQRICLGKNSPLKCSRLNSTQLLLVNPASHVDLSNNNYPKHFHTISFRLRDIAINEADIETPFLNNSHICEETAASAAATPATKAYIKRKQPPKKQPKKRNEYLDILQQESETSFRNEVFKDLKVPIYTLEMALAKNLPERFISEKILKQAEGTKTAAPEKIEAWITEAKTLLAQGNFSQLQDALEQGVVGNYLMTNTELVHFVHELSQLKKYDLCVYVFMSYAPSVQASETAPEEPYIPSATVLEAATAAYISKHFLDCVIIHQTFGDKVLFPGKLINSVLRSFYHIYEPFSARKFLNKIWKSATDETIIAAVRGITRVCYRPAPEIMDLIYTWKQDRQTVDVELYACVLESLLDLQDSARFNEISKLVQADGYIEHPRIKEVHFQKLLHEKNLPRIEAYISMLQEETAVPSSAALSIRPLNRAVSYFSQLDDNDGVSMVVGLYARLGFEHSAEVLNALVTLIYRKGDPAYLVDYVEDWDQTGVVGTNVTVVLIWKCLIRAYQSHSKYITSRFLEMKRKFPNLFLGVTENEALLLNRLVKKESRHENTDYVTMSMYAGSPTHVLRRVQVLGRQGKAEVALEAVREMVSHNVRPTRAIFYNLLHSICRQRLTAEFDEALKMMHEAGYAACTQMEVVFLRTHLESMRKSLEETAATRGATGLLKRLANNQFSVRAAALNKLKNFVGLHANTLNLRSATSLGYEYLLWQDYDAAVGMFGFMRSQSGEDSEAWTSSNTNSFALAGLVRAYAAQGRYTDVYELVRSVCCTETDSRIDVLSFLRIEVARAVQLARKRNHLNAFASQLLECRKMLTRAMLLNNRNRVQADLQVVESLFAVWEKRLVEKTK
ncbi:uncharacterized protein SAPINGB_P004969 [Magnusiomyces paraingens]|uniref:Pentacotripeptide-repeat region of PRORP domain-containing protein n=1 Tax=Magnusiomyces paraingens TaxID=2606893 RepID=A0A5E8C0C1_9ASCO|nr:uncharacterized protein SAPINGB_P004969 [Saprochaete ingens]VVT56325.1 unnamed protein product [Saprochaete ingens]